MFHDLLSFHFLTPPFPPRSWHDFDYLFRKRSRALNQFLIWGFCTQLTWRLGFGFTGECSMQQLVWHRDRPMRTLHQSMVREYGSCISITVMARCSGDFSFFFFFFFFLKKCFSLFLGRRLSPSDPTSYHSFWKLGFLGSASFEEIEVLWICIHGGFQSDSLSPLLPSVTLAAAVTKTYFFAFCRVGFAATVVKASGAVLTHQGKAFLGFCWSFLFLNSNLIWLTCMFWSS